MPKLNRVAVFVGYKAGIALLLLSSASSVFADVVFDGSAGTTGALTGPDYLIEESMGSRINSTLIHSFTEFSLNSSETATFSGSSTIENVISRVTGANPSTIDGLIRSEIGSANFWFLNPNGIVFGENASIDVGGAFFASTASGLQFSNGVVLEISTALEGLDFSISNPQDVVFLLSAASGMIEVQTGTPGDVQFEPTLDMGLGTDLAFIAGEIIVDGANIYVPNGDFTAVAATENTSISTAGSIVNGADLAVVDSTLTVGTDSASGMYIIGGELLISGSTTNVTTDVDNLIKAETLLLSNSRLDVSTNEAGLDVDVDIIAEKLEIVDGSQLITRGAAVDGGNGANFDIQVTGDLLIDSSNINSRVGNATENSSGGDIRISANNLSILGGSVNGFDYGFIEVINSGADSASVGAIDIDVTGKFTLFGGAGIRQQLGNGGLISISTGEMEAIDSPDALVPLFDGEFRPSQVSIDAGRILLDNSNLNNRITNNNTGGSFNMQAGELLMKNNSSINTKTYGTADGIDLNISANTIRLESGSFIGASTLGGGDGGAINLTVADTLFITGVGDVFESSVRSTSADLSVIDTGYSSTQLLGRSGFGEGNGGDINIQADKVVMADGAKITAFAAEVDDTQVGRQVITGNAGSISIIADKSLVLSNGASIETNAVESAGGNINIEVIEYIEISNSEITAEAGGVSVLDDGGNISIDPELLVFTNARINANANAGNGGNVTIVAENIIRSLDTSITASSRLGVDGTIEVEGVTNEASTLESTPVAFDDVAALLSQKCAAASLKDRSSFVVEQQSKLSLSPDSFQHLGLQDNHITENSAGILNQDDLLVTENCLY